MSIHEFDCLFYLVYLLFIVCVCFPNKTNENIRLYLVAYTIYERAIVVFQICSGNT